MELRLASTSPRRRHLLTAAGIAFELCEPGEEDVAGETGAPAELALARARRKARGARVAEGSVPVLGVDTVVDLDGRELGKAASVDAARAMLTALAGRQHRVHTAHCLWWPDRGHDADETASAVVRCRQPSPAELSRYLESGQWRGKAGSYGIQDEAQTFLELAGGAFDTVVGLHVAAVRRLLARGAGR